MRRILPIVVAASALTLALPGAASAHHRSHHRSHHARRARVRTFGAFTRSAAPVTAPTPSAPTPPSPPTTPTPPSPAGTVLSFTEGVLTITLPDKSTVSGKVTENTELECVTAGEEKDDDGPGDDTGTSDARIADHGAGAPGDEEREGSDHGDHEEAAPCTTEALKPGASVLGAELILTSGGPVWERIELGA